LETSDEKYVGEYICEGPSGYFQEIYPLRLKDNMLNHYSGEDYLPQCKDNNYDIEFYETLLPIPSEKNILSQKWVYETKIDPMTSKEGFYAIIESENSISLGFPYEGDQKGTLKLRNHPSYGRDIILSVERGQILCNTYSGCKITVRFDDKKSESWKSLSPSDDSHTSIFIADYEGFLKKMRKSKNIKIQMTFFKEGDQIFEFQVGGFDNQRYKKGK
jgi:hypothetical protein